jgi:hypothetical protein
MSCVSLARAHHLKQYQANKQIIYAKKFSFRVQFIVDRFVRAEVDESGQEVELKDSRHVLVEELAECVQTIYMPKMFHTRTKSRMSNFKSN